MSEHPVLHISKLSRSLSHARWSPNGPLSSEPGLDLFAGQIVVLTGPRGAGTTEILRTLYNAYLGGTGNILYRNRDGETILLPSANENLLAELKMREIAFAGRLRYLNAGLSALDHVARPLIALGQNTLEAKSQARQMLNRLSYRGDPYLAGEPCSKAQRQIIEIAQALVIKPRLLLLDEPFLFISEEQKDAVLHTVKNAANDGSAILVACRHPEMHNLADQVLHLPLRDNSIDNVA